MTTNPAADLDRIAAAWPAVPDDIRALVVALVAGRDATPAPTDMSWLPIDGLTPADLEALVEIGERSADAAEMLSPDYAVEVREAVVGDRAVRLFLSPGRIETHGSDEIRRRLAAEYDAEAERVQAWRERQATLDARRADDLHARRQGATTPSPCPKCAAPLMAGASSAVARCPNGCGCWTDARPVAFADLEARQGEADDRREAAVAAGIVS